MINRLADLIEGLHRQGALGKGPMLHAHGAKVAFNLSAHLSAAGIETHQAVVYEQMPIGFPRHVRALLTVRIPLLVPLFSPRSAELFAFEARDTDARLLLCPISRNAAEKLHGLPQARIEIAEFPDAASVMDAMERQIRSFAS